MRFVDYRDLGKVAALAFVCEDLVNGTFELAAGGMLTRSEIAAMMSRLAGRTVVAVDIAPGGGVGRHAHRCDAGRAGRHVRHDTAYGFRGGNDLVLRTITGRAAHAGGRSRRPRSVRLRP